MVIDTISLELSNDIWCKKWMPGLQNRLLKWKVAPFLYVLNATLFK